MKSSGIGLSDIGKHRGMNEDRLLVNDRLGLYVVSDGMGGYAGGAVAAQIAIETVAAYIQQREPVLELIRSGGGDDGLLSAIAASAAARASRAVYDRACSDPELAQMGCTLTILLVGNRTAAMAHVGDSRLYLARNGRTCQLSTDHTLSQELLDLGIVTADELPGMCLGHVLTRAIGRRPEVVIEQLMIELAPGDRFVLCSDGLSGYIDEPQHLNDLIDDRELDGIARRLVNYANNAGGHDNVTALVVDVKHTHHITADEHSGVYRSTQRKTIPYGCAPAC